jgi:hypothetical protein
VTLQLSQVVGQALRSGRLQVVMTLAYSNKKLMRVIDLPYHQLKSMLIERERKYTCPHSRTKNTHHFPPPFSHGIIPNHPPLVTTLSHSKNSSPLILPTPLLCFQAVQVYVYGALLSLGTPIGGGGVYTGAIAGML